MISSFLLLQIALSSNWHFQRAQIDRLIFKKWQGMFYDNWDVLIVLQTRHLTSYKQISKKNQDWAMFTCSVTQKKVTFKYICNMQKQN